MGEGGFARVFLASDLVLKRQVAIKVLNPGLSEREGFLERFEQEAQSVAVLDHPNILAVYDFGQTDGRAYLVMPYVQGGTVHDQLQQQSVLHPRLACTYLEQAAAAIDYAHRRNLVHRDIKPQNMLVTGEDNRLLLADFGIAKVLDANVAESQTGLAGTLFYMAPEQINGKVGLRLDIYALGCVAFKLLTGRVPYLGSNQHVIDGHLSGPIPSISERSQGRLPASLEPIFEKVLAKKPQDRYATASEFTWDLRTALFGLSEAGTNRFTSTEPFTLPGNRGSKSGSVTPPATDKELFDPAMTPAAPFDGAEADATMALPRPATNEATELIRPAEVADNELARTAIAGLKFELTPLEGFAGGSVSLRLLGPGSTIVAGIRARASANLYFWDERHPDQPSQLQAERAEEIALVSRQHAYLRLVGDKVMLYSGSPEGTHAAANGTFVNGEKLEQGQGRALHNDDLIGFGPRARGPNRPFCREGGVTLVFKAN